MFAQRLIFLPPGGKRGSLYRIGAPSPGLWQFGLGPPPHPPSTPAVVLQEELESVQKRAARFVTDNYIYETGSMNGILGQLKREKEDRLILLYKGLKGKASVPTDDLIPKTRRARNQHSMAFQTPIANTDVYKGSFFLQTIRDWNASHPRFSDLICWICRGLCCKVHFTGEG